jgi:hypothetical protein
LGGRQEFVDCAHPLLITMFQSSELVIGEIFRDSLDALCSALVNSDIRDPDNLRRAVASVREYLNEDCDASYDDRERAVLFLARLLVQDEEVTPDVISNLIKFLSESEY